MEQIKILFSIFAQFPFISPAHPLFSFTVDD